MASKKLCASFLSSHEVARLLHVRFEGAAKVVLFRFENSSINMLGCWLLVFWIGATLAQCPHGFKVGTDSLIH